MKYLNSYLIVFCMFMASALFAQTPLRIETDLHTSFKKIIYWRNHAYDTAIKPDVKYDSLKNANRDFAKKLKFYAEKYPATITYPLKSLKNDLDISTSSDNMFRIYSWDTSMGGETYFFENIMEYKLGADYKVIIDSTKSLGDNRANFRKLYTFIANYKTYYLVEYLFINSEGDWDGGIRIYAIENGQLVDIQLIKTDSGLHTDLFYKVHSSSYGRPKIRFDDTRMTIYLPLIDERYHFTNKFIVYKFTGKYFEKIKS